MAKLDKVSRNGRILMVPMDHGISMGPVVDPRTVLPFVADHATCVAVHKGLLPHVAPFRDRLGAFMHISASTDLAPDTQDKRIVGTVAEALRRGADGVSIHINLGSRTEADQIEAVGAVSAACSEHDVPLFAMVYPRGPGITDPTDPHLVAHAARLGVELGADAVKVPYTGDPATFENVVDGALGIPVVVAGGPKGDLDELLGHLKGARDAGAAGVSIGRNVFEAGDPAAAMRAIAEVFA